MGVRVNEELDRSLTGREVGEGVNYTQIKDDTFGDVNIAFSSLYWLTTLMIVGMVISIFVGSYMVTTRPVFFVPYIFIVIIAVLVSVGISNAYQEVATNPTLASTFSGFVGSNFLMFNLPIWMTVIGFVGGIIMFVRMKSQEGTQYGYQ
jgi:flagellar biosynthesis protein FliQ